MSDTERWERLERRLATLEEQVRVLVGQRGGGEAGTRSQPAASHPGQAATSQPPSLPPSPPSSRRPRFPTSPPGWRSSRFWCSI